MELGLGTVTFGMAYGIANKVGRLDIADVTKILEAAWKGGARVLDTAAAYGDSETVLGSAMPTGTHFRIVTKLPALGKDRWTATDIDNARRTVETSLDRLGTGSVAGLLMHGAGDLLLPGGEAMYRLLASLRDEGVTGSIGVSVYTGEDIDRLFERYDLQLVQLPLNVLDQRLKRSGRLACLREKGVEIHVRSAFLQGLLLMPPEHVDPYFEPVQPVLGEFRDMCRREGMTPVEGAFAYMRSVPEVDVVLVGVESAGQLEENLAAFGRQAPAVDYSRFAVDDPRFVNPGLWRLTGHQRS